MRIFLSTLALVALSACASEPTLIAADEAGPSRARGHAIAERLCSACHAIGAVGASPNEEAPAFRRLGERYPPGVLAEAFAEGIVVGHPAMPQFELQPQEIDDLIAYLEWVQAGGSVPNRPAAP
jgi:cytochrome c